MGSSRESVDKIVVNDEEYRRKFDTQHQEGEPNQGKLTGDGQTRVKDPYMADAGNDPFNPREYEPEGDLGRGQDPPRDSRYSDKPRDRHHREKDETRDKQYKSSSSSQDEYNSHERGLNNPAGYSSARGRDFRDDMAHSAAAYSYNKSSGPLPTRRTYKEEFSTPKEKQSWFQWTFGGVLHRTHDPNVALSKIQTANTELAKENSGLKKTLASYEGQVRMIHNIQNERDAALNKAGRLEQENTRLQEVQQSQSSQVRMAQELMLKNKTVQGALADEDRTIRLNFKTLQGNIRDWGKDWAHSDITSLDAMDEEERTATIKYLAKVIKLDAQGKFPPGMTSSEKIITKAPALCLSAVLSNEICESVFEQPFRILQASTADSGAEERRILPPGDQTIDRVYAELARYDEVKAQAWRCQTLEILDPSVIKSEAAALARRDAQRRRAGLAIELADAFLSCPATKLLRPSVTSSEERKRLKSLQSIFSEALEMSARLWKQPTILRCRLFGDLIVEPFKNGSEFMDAHPLHQLGVRGEDDESEVTRLDNHQIMMAVSPAIIALGDSDGENYSHHRVWAKGVVWLEE